VGKLTLLALEATFRHYEEIEEARTCVPALAMLAEDTNSLAERAAILCEHLQRAVPDENFYVCSDVSYAGGGSLPTRELATVVVQWRPTGRRVDAVMSALRSAEIPVIARVREDAICFDLRTIREDDYEDLTAAVASTAFGED
jgi:L-seryl-tRNA(Ser) seleniumtransferase